MARATNRPECRPDHGEQPIGRVVRRCMHLLASAPRPIRPRPFPLSTPDCWHNPGLPVPQPQEALQVMLRCAWRFHSGRARIRWQSNLHDPIAVLNRNRRFPIPPATAATGGLIGHDAGIGTCTKCAVPLAFATDRENNAGRSTRHLRRMTVRAEPPTHCARSVRCRAVAALVPRPVVLLSTWSTHPAATQRHGVGRPQRTSSLSRPRMTRPCFRPNPIPPDGSERS